MNQQSEMDAALRLLKTATEARNDVVHGVSVTLRSKWATHFCWATSENSRYNMALFAGRATMNSALDWLGWAWKAPSLRDEDFLDLLALGADAATSPDPSVLGVPSDQLDFMDFSEAGKAGAAELLPRMILKIYNFSFP